MPKQSSDKKSKRMRHSPLEVQMDVESQARKKMQDQYERRQRVKAKRSQRKGEEEEEEDMMEEDEDKPSPMDKALSRKILLQASDQMREEEVEAGTAAWQAGAGGGGRVMPPLQEGSDEDEDLDDDGDEEEEEEDEDEDEDEEEMVEVRDGKVHTTANSGLSEAEERVVSCLMDGGPRQRRTLADIIMEKIREKEEAAVGEDDCQESSSLPPKVREVYTEIGFDEDDMLRKRVMEHVIGWVTGKMLKHYTAGKLPKAFKVIPVLSNWEDVIYLTRPDEWTPHATYAATRLFASNLNAKLVQRFYHVILLEKVRDDIHENKNLNYHYYMALKKAMYKPGAFFKGIVLPLAMSGDCNIREATIVGSVLAKVSIPVNHSAVVLLKLAQIQHYSPACSIFLKVLLNKKYTLPHRVVDAVVDYFLRFGSSSSSSSSLPVLWHQGLLVFAQRYKEDLTEAQKEGLKEVLKCHEHHQITPEIRRELFHLQSRCRGPTPMVTHS